MRVTIKTKLGLTFGLVILLASVMAWLGISSLGSLNTALDNLVQGPVERQRIALETNSSLLAMVRAEKNMALAESKEEIERSDAEIAGLRQTFLTQLDKADTIATTEGRPKWAALRVDWQARQAIQDKMREAAKSGTIQEVKNLSTGQARQLLDVVQKQLGEIIELNSKFMTQAQLDASVQYDRARTLLLAAIAASLLIAIGAGIWISLSISRGLGRAGALAQAVAGGDLTQTVDTASNDEIGDLVGHINTMVQRLRSVVGEAMAASDNVSSGSQELSSSAEELSQGATEQASSTEEASASMEEMAANIKQNADNASQTEKIARQSATDAQTSGEAVGRAVEAMRTIAEKHHHRAGDRAADRPAGAQRRGRGGTRRRARQGLRGGGLRGAQAGRAQPDGSGGDRHLVHADGEGGAGCRRDVGQAGA